MGFNKKQLHRLTRIVSLLKENRYPNSASLVKEFRKMEELHNLNIACSKETVKRDMKALADEFNCPLGFDRKKNGYYLKHHGWNFSCPAVLDENEMLASVLGARIAEEIFPEPLRGRIRAAVDFQLSTNNPDFLDNAFVKSLTVFAGLNVSINADLFMTLFECWRDHEAADIVYEALDGSKSERRVEPHALVFFDSSWYIKTFCLKRNQIRTFALHRIISAAKAGKFFEPDDKIINQISRDNFLAFERVENVKIICDKSLKSFLETNPLNTKQTMKKLDNGKFLLNVPSVTVPELIHWTLYQKGKAVVVEPQSIRKEILIAAKEICDLHS